MHLTPEVDGTDLEDIKIDQKDENVKLIPGSTERYWDAKVFKPGKPLIADADRVEKPAKKDVVKEDIDFQSFDGFKNSLIKELEEVIKEELDFSKLSFYKLLKDKVSNLTEKVDCQILNKLIDSDTELQKLAKSGAFDPKETVSYICELI